MLLSANDLQHYTVQGADTSLGTVDHLYFDLPTWIVRYLALDTGGMLAQRLALISPQAVTALDADTGVVRVPLTQEQVADSPPIYTNQELARPVVAALFDYYGWPYYWTEGTNPPASQQELGAVPTQVAVAQSAGAPLLRSTQQMTGYPVEDTGGHAGYVSDFLVDAESWAIRYLVLDTRDWMPGKSVLVAPEWVTEVDWALPVIRTDVTADQLQAAPEYSGTPPNRDDEEALYQHYHRNGYWTAR
jgi:pimeloyl-ACP methyl ester carboxylesterase